VPGSVFKTSCLVRRIASAERCLAGSSASSGDSRPDAARQVWPRLDRTRVGNHLIANAAEAPISVPDESTLRIGAVATPRPWPGATLVPVLTDDGVDGVSARHDVTSDVRAGRGEIQSIPLRTCSAIHYNPSPLVREKVLSRMAVASNGRSLCLPRRERIETNLTRSTSVRIKFGIKAWSTLSAMLLSVVMISGCNDDTSSTPTPTPGAGAGAGKAPDKKPETPAATPTTKPEDKKKM